MMLQVFEAALFLVVLLVAVIISWAMPSLTRSGILFGVTVPPGARAMPSVQAVIRRYRAGVVVIAILATAALAVGLALGPTSWWETAWPSIIMLIAVLALEIPYLLAYFAMRAIVPALPRVGAPYDTAPVADLRPRRYSDGIPLVLEVLPLAVIAATAAYLASNYAVAPAVIPIHFAADGASNGFAAKTVASYFSMVWTQVLLYVLLTALSVGIVSAKALPDRADERFRQRGLRLMFAIKVLTLLLLAAVAVASSQAALAGGAAAGWLLPVSLGFTVLVLVGVLGLTLLTGQGGSRLASAGATDRLDDSYWKLGEFYVNRNDPALFVERRNGFGWTVNFGNPRTILFFVGLLVFIGLLQVLGAVSASGAR
ncbi:MAG: DUF5808 domain-containing protein [Ktedonobacterales bacterium]